LPGRAILKAGLKPQDFEGLNPFQQAEKLKPVWSKAGDAVAATAQQQWPTLARCLQSACARGSPRMTRSLVLAPSRVEQVRQCHWHSFCSSEASTHPPLPASHGPAHQHHVACRSNPTPTYTTCPFQYCGSSPSTTTRPAPSCSSLDTRCWYMFKLLKKYSD
jgi:hypothetical protein